MNFTERLSRDVARAARMTLPELEEALEKKENQTVSRLTALSLAKKAAEGGMDAVKMIRELTRLEPERKAAVQTPMVELRVVEAGDE